MHHEPSDPSCTTVSDGNLFTFNNNRHLSDTSGVFQHLLESAALFFYIHVVCIFAICRPGILCMGSATFAINDNLFCHERYLSFCNLKLVICLLCPNTLPRNECSQSKVFLVCLRGFQTCGTVFLDYRGFYDSLQPCSIAYTKSIGIVHKFCSW